MSDDPQDLPAEGGDASGEPMAPGAGATESVPLPSKPLGRRAQAAAKKAEKEAAKKAEEMKALHEREVPADAYVVELPTFQGPLDLLLHLIQKHELDILDIPVSFVTEKYLAYLDVMRKLSIDVASEYLVMAATLLHIKSKMLLPQLPGGEDEVGEEEEEDPRAELVRRLLDYQKYKAAAEDLGGRESMLGRDVFGRGSGEIAPPGPAPFQPFGVFNLFDALEKVLSRTKAKVEHNVVFDRISITDRIVELTQKMKSRRQMLFDELFEADRSTFEVVITFLAMLEMCKLKLMRVYQADVLAAIHVELMVVDDVAEGDELEFAQSGGQSLASGPLPPPTVGGAEGEARGEDAVSAEAALEAEPAPDPPADPAPEPPAEPESPSAVEPGPEPESPSAVEPGPEPESPSMVEPPAELESEIAAESIASPEPEGARPPGAEESDARSDSWMEPSVETRRAPLDESSEASSSASSSPDASSPDASSPEVGDEPSPPWMPDEEPPRAPEPDGPRELEIEMTARFGDDVVSSDAATGGVAEPAPLDPDAAFEAEFAALLAEEEAERQAALVAAAPTNEIQPGVDGPATTDGAPTAAPTVDD